MDLLSQPLTALLALGIGYLSGSVPYGLLITRAFGLGDVRSIGSGNIGATNVLRTGKKGVAFLTLLLDMLKATVPMVLLFVLWLTPSLELTLVVGLGAFLGHLFPVWMGFKGGKGIASYVGVLLGLGWLANWWLLLAFAVVWLTIAFALRYSSLAALVAVAVVAILGFGLLPLPPAALLALMSLISWWTHRTNIGRLLAGKEAKIGAK